MSGLNPHDAASCLPAEGTELERNVLSKRLGAKVRTCRGSTEDKKIPGRRQLSEESSPHEPASEPPLAGSAAGGGKRSGGPPAGYSIGPDKRSQELLQEGLDVEEEESQQGPAAVPPLTTLPSSRSPGSLRDDMQGAPDLKAPVVMSAAPVSRIALIEAVHSIPNRDKLLQVRSRHRRVRCRFQASDWDRVNPPPGDRCPQCTSNGTRKKGAGPGSRHHRLRCEKVRVQGEEGKSVWGCGSLR